MAVETADVRLYLGEACVGSARLKIKVVPDSCVSGVDIDEIEIEDGVELQDAAIAFVEPSRFFEFMGAWKPTRIGKDQ